MDRELRSFAWFLLIPVQFIANALTGFASDGDCLLEMKIGKMKSGSSGCHIWHLALET
jgi:hypothetical protein